MLKMQVLGSKEENYIGVKGPNMRRTVVKIAIEMTLRQISYSTPRLDGNWLFLLGT